MQKQQNVIAFTDIKLKSGYLQKSKRFFDKSVFHMDNMYLPFILLGASYI